MMICMADNIVAHKVPDSHKTLLVFGIIASNDNLNTIES